MPAPMVPIPGTGPPPTPEFLAETRQPAIRAVTWLSAALPTIIVLVRCYTRVVVRKVFGVDDWLIVLAVLLLLSYAAVLEASVEQGFGLHLAAVLRRDPSSAVRIARLGVVCQPLVIMSCALGKTSFSATLLRIAAQPPLRAAVWFVMVTVNLVHVAICVCLFARCRDPRALWDPSVQTYCWPAYYFNNLSYFIGAYSAATDFTLALLPWAMLWNLNMKNKEKGGVAVAMSMGIFAGAAAIIKCTYLAANSEPKDPTYDLAPLLWWAGTENALIILAACVPTLRPLLSKLFPSAGRYKSDENSHQLRDMSGNGDDAFAPRSNKASQWNALVETETQPDQASDNNSQRSILNQSRQDDRRHSTQDSSEYGRKVGTKKIIAVDVSYDEGHR
ncbi:hypothetical protein N3K66_007863 [Trichothecium roseum]|uniref:Uncharacterized protein n=1 Tax=Trichothecium roseum TaxID=47278 RepID=A0ACC0URX6_9HYPO|nr:hypothetical protein N3K66_007863 [Trichothecium roseum]